MSSENIFANQLDILPLASSFKPSRPAAVAGASDRRQWLEARWMPAIGRVLGACVGEPVRVAVVWRLNR